MKRQEKKYLVDNFAAITKQLQDLGVKAGKTATSTHYYAMQAGNNVTKLVMHGDVAAIHILDEVHGRFVLREDIPVASQHAGLDWLVEEGYSSVYVVTMTHTDYEFRDGILGLYAINDKLLSVILDYAEGEHMAIEQILGLENAEVIEVPYNVYLKRAGQLTAVTVASLQ